jgi:hypothetical protein
MFLPAWMRGRVRLPSRIALLLGFGALSAAGAQADATEVDHGSKPERVPQQSGKAFGELAVWTEAGRVYVSESGKPARELSLGNTAEAAYLRELLERNGANATSPSVVPDRVILVGGGGAGIGWVPADKSQAPAGSAAPDGTSAGRTAPGGPAATGFGRATPRPPARTAPPENQGLPSKASTIHSRENG